MKTIIWVIFLVIAPILANAQDLRDKSGIKIGSIEKDGTVRDKSGIKLGEIEDDGDVRDKSGIKIGTAEGIDKKKAAWIFFFS